MLEMLNFSRFKTVLEYVYTYYVLVRNENAEKNSESRWTLNKAFPQPEGLCPTQTIPIDSSMIYNYDNYRIIVIIVIIVNITN